MCAKSLLPLHLKAEFCDPGLDANIHERRLEKKDSFSDWMVSMFYSV